MEENSVEAMFGADVLNYVHKCMIKEVAGEPELKILFDAICETIDGGTITDLELVRIMKVLPYEIVTTIFDELKNRNSLELRDIYSSVLYDQFIKDCNNIDAKGETGFEKRFTKQNKVNALENRLLTRYEIEDLIDTVVKKEGLKGSSYSYTHEKYDGKHKYLKLLIKAHKSLSDNRNSSKLHSIMKQIKPSIMQAVLIDLKKYENIIETN